jgi:hypothetical protein
MSSAFDFINIWIKLSEKERLYFFEKADKYNSITKDFDNLVRILKMYGYDRNALVEEFDCIRINSLIYERAIDLLHI